MVLALVFGTGIPLRLSATSSWCDSCLSCIGGTRSAERFKVGRGIFTCMCALGAGVQFLLAPVLSFGWNDNVVCVANVTCAVAMVKAAAKVDGHGTVCCSDYAVDPGIQCNQATYRILFIVTAGIFPFALCLALTTALQEKAKFHGKKNGRGGQRLVTDKDLEESELDDSDEDDEDEDNEEDSIENENKV